MDQLIGLDSLLRNLQAGVKSIGMYPLTHPTAKRFLSRIQEDLEGMLSDQATLVLGVVDHALVAVGLPFAGTEAIALAFAERLEDRGISCLEVRRGGMPEGVSECVQLLVMQPEAFQRLGRVDEVRAQRGVQAIRFSSRAPSMEEQAEPLGQESLGRSLTVYRDAVGSVKRILTEARLGRIPSLAEAQTAVAGLVDGVLKHQNAMLALTMIKSYDEYLFTHSVNVGVLCIALAQSLGMDSETIKELGLGGLLHDIGKVHWPETLYQKPRGLSDEEWALVQRHPLDGAEIVERMGGVSPTAMEVILEHHLRYDRKGIRCRPREGTRLLRDDRSDRGFLRCHDHRTRLPERLRAVQGGGASPEPGGNGVRLEAHGSLRSHGRDLPGGEPGAAELRRAGPGGEAQSGRQLMPVRPPAVRPDRASAGGGAELGPDGAGSRQRPAPSDDHHGGGSRFQEL
jgi:putative nucleotidyltransferase with HDIG domain